MEKESNEVVDVAPNGDVIALCDITQVEAIVIAGALSFSHEHAPEEHKAILKKTLDKFMGFCGDRVNRKAK